MKKYFSMFAVAALTFAAVACGNKTDGNNDTNGNDSTAVEQTADATPADEVANKIEAGQPLTEDDFVVILDYVTDMTKEMNANPENSKEILDKYQYIEIFSAPFDEWVDKAETLKPETQQKIKDYLLAVQN